MPRASTCRIVPWGGWWITCGSTAEPTLLLFFGDHLPMLGEDHLVFRETGYIGSESNHELMKDLRMMTVPYIFWSNYDTPTGEQPVMNASFLAPQLLQLARKEMPQYLKVVASIREEMPLLMRDHGINASGRRVSAETSEYQLARAKYHQANLLFLQQTPEGDTGKWVIAENDSYRQSVQELVIHEIKHENMTTEISGGRFDPRLTLLVDQIPVDFWCLDENTLLVESRLEPGSVMVLQRMTTSGNVMAESPPFRVP
jgi:hypothetical protein